MLVRILESFVTADAAYNRGQVVNLPNEVAESVVRAGHAERYTPPAHECAALAGGTESAMKRTAKPRARPHAV